MLKPIPHFNTEQEERVFWESHDSTEYVDWSKACLVEFPNLKTSTQSISLRLPVDMLQRLKKQAMVMDVPYQSLMKIWLNEKLDQSPR